MAEYTWVFDAPTGTYKNNALSNDILEAAIAQCQVAPFARNVNGYGKGKGENVTLTRVQNISEPTSAVLSEVSRIPEDSFSITTKSITVQELGRAVPYTELAVDLAYFDIENAIQRKLTQQLSLVMDSLAIAGLKNSKLKFQPTGLSSYTLSTGGAATVAATANMNVYFVEELRDMLYDTYQVPPYEGSDYVGIFRTKALRGIKRDPSWEEWHKYTDPQSKWNNEVGRIECVRFVETNHGGTATASLAPTAIPGLNICGTGSVLGEGLVFGDEALYLAEVLTPELRAGLPEDFGRSKSVAWYGILKFDIPWDTANVGEAKSIHVTSLT